MSAQAPSRGSRLDYLPQLDGVRAIAIGAVLLFHGGTQWLPGGFLGVDVFFVLSGYLITSLLLDELTRSGSLSLGGFYRNRARRLLPALLVMVFVVATYAMLSMQDSVASTWRDLPWAIGGLSNWWLILHQQSYFESIGRPLLFQHTWSLAVEAQFYLIWPLALLFIVPKSNRLVLRRIAFVCAGASATALLVFGSRYDSASNLALSHLYFGTDTHSMGLFLGAALAASRKPVSLGQAGVTSRRLGDLLAVLALVALAGLFHFVTEAMGREYLAGIPACAAVTVALLAAVTQAGSRVGGWLAVRPLRWIGERSYGIYLWHWPVFQATRPGLDIALVGLPDLVFRLAVTIGIAELSYRFVEMPVRRGALRRLWARMRGWKPMSLRWTIAGALTATIAFAFVETALAQRAIKAYDTSLESITKPSTRILAMTRSLDALEISATRHAGSLAKTRKAAWRVALNTPAMLIGDSIMLGVSPLIEQRINVAKVDAVVARQAIPTLEVIEQLAQDGDLYPTMVIDLGSNGTVDESTLRAMLHVLRSRKYVVIVNANVPRPWSDENDVMMARVVPQYPNAALADWRAASTGHPEYFVDDGVHPTPLGGRIYAAVIADALISIADREVDRDKGERLSADPNSRLASSR